MCVCLTFSLWFRQARNLQVCIFMPLFWAYQIVITSKCRGFLGFSNIHQSTISTNNLGNWTLAQFSIDDLGQCTIDFFKHLILELKKNAFYWIAWRFRCSHYMDVWLCYFLKSIVEWSYYSMHACFKKVFLKYLKACRLCVSSNVCSMECKL